MNPRARLLRLCCLVLPLFPSLGLRAEALQGHAVFDDAVAVWHFRDLNDSGPDGSELARRGHARVGIALTGESKEASLVRGGDGYAAKLDGGCFDAGQGMDDKLNVEGNAFTLCARLRDPAGTWMAPLFSKHGGHSNLVYNLFSHDFGNGGVIGFELGTERSKGVTQVFVPLELIGATEWHDLICRYDGAKLQLFVDGVWMDEEFPMGPLHKGNREPCLIGGEAVNGSIKSGWRGWVDHIAIWKRALSDEEIQSLSGGARAVAANKERYVGPLPSMQYFRPHNQFSVGDTLPFFHDGIFRFYYLLDRGHHTAKGGYGAHQWAQASSRDLIHWTEHPLAVPITRESEGSICTGSVFFHGGVYYAFYATRVIGKGEQLSLAAGTDGVRFTKTEPNPVFVADAKYANGFRDPHLFLDAQTGLFHLIISTMLKEGNRGCLAHYASKDLKTWQEEEPFLVEGNEVPECPDYFEWNGRYYLIFSNGGVARYRTANRPLGPWQKPKVDVLDGAAARVMKTAAFTGNRRIGTAGIWLRGYAGCAVFRELVQQPDGTLATRFVPEMIPLTGDPVTLEFRGLSDGTSGDGRQVQVHSADGIASASLLGVPVNARVQLRVVGKAESIGIRVRSINALGGGGHQLLFDNTAKKVWLAGGQSLANVEGLDEPFLVDLILKDNILDACIGQRRTLVNLISNSPGEALVLSVEKGEATFDQISVRPLRNR